MNFYPKLIFSLALLPFVKSVDAGKKFYITPELTNQADDIIRGNFDFGIIDGVKNSVNMLKALNPPINGDNVEKILEVLGSQTKDKHTKALIENQLEKGDFDFILEFEYSHYSVRNRFMHLLLNEYIGKTSKFKVEQNDTGGVTISSLGSSGRLPMSGDVLLSDENYESLVGYFCKTSIRKGNYEVMFRPGEYGHTKIPYLLRYQGAPKLTKMITSKNLYEIANIYSNFYPKYFDEFFRIAQTLEKYCITFTAQLLFDVYVTLEDAIRLFAIKHDLNSNYVAYEKSRNVAIFKVKEGSDDYTALTKIYGNEFLAAYQFPEGESNYYIALKNILYDNDRSAYDILQMHNQYHMERWSIPTPFKSKFRAMLGILYLFGVDCEINIDDKRTVSINSDMMSRIFMAKDPIITTVE